LQIVVYILLFFLIVLVYNKSQQIEEMLVEKRYDHRERGFMPMRRKMEVRYVKSIEEIPVAAHTVGPNSCVPTGQPVLTVPEHEPLGDNRHQATLALRHIAATKTGFKTRRVVQPPHLASLSTSEFYDYSVLAACEHAYWFCVYSNALPDDIIKESRQSSNSQTSQLAWTELSLTELLYISQNILGIEVIEEHIQSRETTGYITDVHFDYSTSSLYVLVRPHNTDRGRELCKQIEFKGKRECSLSHARYRNLLQVHELSICTKGARPGTTFISAVVVADTPRWHYKPRIFETPPFCIVAEGGYRIDASKTPHTATPPSVHSHNATYITRTRVCTVDDDNSLGSGCTKPNTPWTQFTVGSTAYTKLVSYLSDISN
jgi:hypothetical protein